MFTLKEGAWMDQGKLSLTSTFLCTVLTDDGLQTRPKRVALLNT